MASVEDKINELHIMLLQLQRSALLDTQTLLQLLVNKGICSVDEIVATRDRIELEDPIIQQLDDAILERGGVVNHPAAVDSAAVPTEIQGKIKALEEMLTEMLAKTSK